MDNFLKLLETLSRKRLVGTIVLGQRNQGFEVFVEEDLLYLGGDSYLGKADLVGLAEAGIPNEKIPPSALESALMATDLTHSLLCEALYSRQLIPPDTFGVLARKSLQEDLFSRLMHSPNSFYFQDGYVPDGIIGDASATIKQPIPLADFAALVEQRMKQLEEIRHYIPTLEEVVIVTEKGMKKQQEAAGDIGLRCIFDLIDGFRNLGSIVQDAYLHRFYVEQRIVEGLRKGWLKKTQMPELRNVQPEHLSPEEAEQYLPLFRTAIKYGTDELAARRGLAKTLERLNRNEEAANQHNFIGDTFFQMGKRSQAIQAYFEGLRLIPGLPLISDKLVRIYHAEAQSNVRAGKTDVAIRLYKSILGIHPDDPVSFHSLLALFANRRQTDRMIELCDHAIGRSRVTKDPSLAIGLLRKCLSSLPTNTVLFKRLINLYLDFQMKPEALDAMERLAMLHVEAGHREQAATLVDKILKSDPGRSHLREFAGKQRRPARRAGGQKLLSRCVLLALLVGAGYHLWLFWQIRDFLYRSQISVAQAALPPPSNRRTVGLRPSVFERTLDSLNDEAARIRQSGRPSLFDLVISRIQRKLNARLGQIEKARNETKKKLLNTMLLALDKGEEEAALALFRTLRSCPPDDAIRIRAEEELGRFRGNEAAAEQMWRQAQGALAESDVDRAYDLVRRLTERYPASSIAREARFPIYYESYPEATSATINGEPGEGHGVVHVAPDFEVILGFERPGFQSRRLRVLAADGPRLRVALKQLPHWTASGARFELFQPSFGEDELYVTSRKGDLISADLATGKLRTVHQSDDLVRPLAPPLRCGPQLVVAMNNGRILRFEKGFTRAKTHEVKGLVVGTPVVISPGALAFATSSRQVIVYDPAANEAVSSVALHEEASRLAKLGDGVVGLDGSSRVFRSDFDRQTIAWEVELKGGATLGPTLLGDARRGVVVVLERRSRVVALDPPTGSTRWTVDIPGRPQKVVFLEQARRIFAIVASGVVELTPLEAPRVKTFQGCFLAGGFDELVELKTGLGVFRDGAFYLLDGPRDEPSWAYIPDERESPIRQAATDGRMLALLNAKGELMLFRPPPR